MNGNFKDFNERSGLSYHEAEFKFHLVHSLQRDVSYFYGEYFTPCKTPPIQLAFQVEARNVNPGKSMSCLIRMKRMDYLVDTITIIFTLSISNKIGFVSPVINFSDSEFGFCKEIERNFETFLHHSTCSMLFEPLIVEVRLRLVDCHKNEEINDNLNPEEILKGL